MKSLLCVCVLFLQTLLFSKERLPSVEALIVYDTAPKPMKIAYRSDAQKVRAALKRIASQAKFRLRLKMVNSKQFSKMGVKKLMQSKAISKKNVFFFYYAGSGLKVMTPSKPISKGARLSPKRSSLRITEDVICKSVQYRNPRLSIILMDCYKSSVRVPMYSASASRNLFTKSAQSAFKRLFLEAKGTVSATSSANPEGAFGLDEPTHHGGLFTSSLLYALSYADDNSSWAQIMREVSFLCRYDRYARQTPHIQVQVTPDRSLPLF